MRRKFRLSLLAAAGAAAFAALPVSASAAGLAQIRFVVVDPLTRQPTNGAVFVEEAGETRMLSANALAGSASWRADGGLPDPNVKSTVVTIPLGASVTLTQGGQNPPYQVPVKEITIHVTATRIVPNQAPVAASGTSRSRDELNKFVNTTQTDTRQLTKGQAGVAEDSNGQQHVRGEHTDITYVIDGVPLPDTLSGRQGAVVVPSTIQNLEIITGGFAPEFGGQTAAVLNVTTLPSVEKATGTATLQGGSYNTLNGDLTAMGPIGSKLNYVVDINANRTDVGDEPPQPDRQDAHNFGSSRSIFTKLRYAPNAKDAYVLTLANNPDNLQIANRTGLPASFARSGEGYGIFGLRNADGTRPDVNASNAGLLGAETIKLPSQEDAGQDIFEHDITEYATLNVTHKTGARDGVHVAVTALHSGQDLDNHNPAVDLGNLPVDNSIEYNPTVSRNIHHLQALGDYTLVRGAHHLKAGVLYDYETGVESYNIVPASQLALDALAAIDPALAPAGAPTGATDVNGFPVYRATGVVAPTQVVQRTGTYKAAYLQDTWQSGRLSSNYGLRFDWYNQNQDLGQPDVHAFETSPRLNFQYRLNRLTDLHAAYNHLFNTPPLAQGALVGQAIQPEIVDQYDLSLTHRPKPGQAITVAYYAKQIKNQVDVALLIPGSQIGLYSAVNFQRAGVHGIEFSYDFTPRNNVGWDGYLNYSYSSAEPNGVDNTGAPAPDYNDHDQRHTVGAGLAYSWKSGATAALTFTYGSGLASSVVPPGDDRTPRTEVDLHAETGDRLFRGRGGLTLDVENLFDSRDVINFQSDFSGTRFQMGRRILVGATLKF